MTRSQRWAQRYPERRAAHRAVERALRNGTLVKQACEACGAAASRNVHACHDDYAKPLEVRWRCATCHIGREHWATAILPRNARASALT